MTEVIFFAYSENLSAWKARLASVSFCACSMSALTILGWQWPCHNEYVYSEYNVSVHLVPGGVCDRLVRAEGRGAEEPAAHPARHRPPT